MEIFWVKYIFQLPIQNTAGQVHMCTKLLKNKFFNFRLHCANYMYVHVCTDRPTVPTLFLNYLK